MRPASYRPMAPFAKENAPYKEKRRVRLSPRFPYAGAVVIELTGVAQVAQLAGEGLLVYAQVVGPFAARGERSAKMRSSRRGSPMTATLRARVPMRSAFFASR